MRDPVLSRSNRRAGKLRVLRIGAFAVIGIAVISVAVGVLIGDDPTEEELPTPEVAFQGTFAGEGDRAPDDAAVQREGEAIVELLDGWYQQAFVDPERFGDGTFPEVAALFDEEARAAFTEDVAALTIGPAREEVDRVEPTTSTADITIFFEDGEQPRWATATVTFAARATLKDDAAFPLGIDQAVTLVLQRAEAGWLVSTFYDATQEQRSIEASPSPTGSPA